MRKYLFREKNKIQTQHRTLRQLKDSWCDAKNYMRQDTDADFNNTMMV